MGRWLNAGENCCGFDDDDDVGGDVGVGVDAGVAGDDGSDINVYD